MLKIVPTHFLHFSASLTVVTVSCNFQSAHRLEYILLAFFLEKNELLYVA